MSEVAPKLQDYWNFRDEGCNFVIIVYGKKCHEKIHGSHIGMEKCISRATQGLSWPNISKHIKDVVVMLKH